MSTGGSCFSLSTMWFPGIQLRFKAWWPVLLPVEPFPGSWSGFPNPRLCTIFLLPTPTSCSFQNLPSSHILCRTQHLSRCTWVPQHTQGGQRTTLQNWFSSTFTWSQWLHPSVAGLHSKPLYSLNHLANAGFWGCFGNKVSLGNP